MESSRLTYGPGWYPEENDGIYSFRWMKEKAAFYLKNYQLSGKKYLRILAGHSFPKEKFPVLEVFVNGQKKGEKEIEAAFCSYAFSFEEKGDIKFEFKLNKSFQAPDDPRKLGIMIRKIRILHPSETDIFFEGWYQEESSVFSPAVCRWMRKEAKCLFANIPKKVDKYLLIEGGHPFKEAKNPILTISIEGKMLVQREILYGENKYLFPFNFFSDVLEFDLKLDKTFDPSFTQDPRTLGIIVKKIEIFIPEEENCLYEAGWYGWEDDEFFIFQWMSQRARVFLPLKHLKKHKYISFYISSDFVDFSQKLTISLGKDILCEIPLLYRWNYYSFSLHNPFHSSNEGKKEVEDEWIRPDVPRRKGKNELVLSLNKVFPEKYHKDDQRELGIRVSPMEFHDDDEAHKNFLFFHKNALVNYREMRDGKKRLESYPLNLGVDLYGKCNIKPSCVYCLWDRMKKLEGKYVETTVDKETLESYGPFFLSARLIINCSFGEPLLHPRFQEILEFCESQKKILEISTNGQSFTKRTITALVGKPIFLYISLDAACKETYAKIRNDRWESIIPNLMLLNQERKKNNHLPKIYMVFMPMRVNEGDLEDYFRLCQKIEADSLVLRPLNYLENPQIEIDREGYHFDYEKELLSNKELEGIFRKCDELSKKYGVLVANQFTFGTIQEPGSRKKSALFLEKQRF